VLFCCVALASASLGICLHVPQSSSCAVLMTAAVYDGACGVPIAWLIAGLGELSSRWNAVGHKHMIPAEL
jgi:hypothetical protein